MATSADRRPDLQRPSVRFTDREGRSIAVAEHGTDPGPLVEMYDRFGDGARAQGLPPRDERRRREWVVDLLENGLNVVAEHGDDVVGHAALLPGEDAAELAIFVRPDYQSAGVGTRLIRCLLGEGRASGIDHVWLTVSRENSVAVNLYTSAGFETTARRRGDYEMERDL